MSIHVLGPIKPWHLDKGNHDENMRSVVVLAGDKSMKGLFMGDADMLGELVLTHLRMDIRAHILKVAHHGSRRSCLEPFWMKSCQRSQLSAAERTTPTATHRPTHYRGSVTVG